jgi:hypothetical protein
VEWEEEDKVEEDKYYMDGGLRKILNTIAYNVPNDWDSLILISGDGMVRVGKSVLAQQVGKELSTKLKTSWTLNNIVFSGSELMEKSKTFPKNSVFVYDEARGELDTKKVMEDITKTLMDFFAECGMYNHIIIIVLPDFFDLPKGIAISRSELLLNVYRDRSLKKDKDGEDVVRFERGFFDGYHRQGKKRLYILGKKNFNDYGCVKRDFFGHFPNTFTVNKKEYEDKKRVYLARDRRKEDKDFKFDAALTLLTKSISAFQLETEFKKLGVQISNDTIMRHISKFTKEST